jgi:acetyltransferase-like isoleucine patch superfamily enzyme
MARGILLVQMPLARVENPCHEGRVFVRLEGVISCKRGENVRLGSGVFVSGGCEILDDGLIEIGDGVILGEGVRVVAEEKAGVRIGRGAWIGDGAELRPGARVGSGAMVCAGSVVDGEVPDNAVVEGRPARVTWYLR